MSVGEDNEMTGDPHRHTKSEGLKRLLRRRGRRGKVGANTGEKVYSWAEYSQVNFTPTGDRSSLGCGLGALLVMFALLLVPVVVGTVDAVIEGRSLPDILGAIIQSIFVYAIIGLFLAIPVAVIILIYIALDGNSKEDRDHLIAKADKLRAKQDESANRAR